MTSSFPGHEPAPGVVVSSRLRTAAGSPLPVEVTLTNTASTARLIAVGAIGVDSSWLPPMTRTELLEPGQSVVVTLTLSPAIGTVPAQYPLAFTAQSLDPISGRPGGAPPAMVDSVLVVNPRNQLEIELVPRRVSMVSSRRVRMTMRNTGDDVARVKVGVQASPRLRVRFKREDVEVLPGATEQVKGRVSVPRPRFFGTIAHHAYTVTARGTESVRHVEGSVTQRPFVNTFVLKAVALLAVVSVWIAAAVIFIPGLADRLGDRQSETTTTAVEESGDGSGSSDSGGSDGGGSDGSGGQGDQAGAGGDGKGGGAQPAVATDDQPLSLTGTVAGDDPGGVRVRLEPTSLVDEGAQGGVGVGVPSSQLGNTGMSLASSFLNQALDQTPADRTATTTKDGSWSFAAVKSPGYYLLTFSKPGYQSRSYVVDSSSENAAEPLEVELSAGQGQLSGTVTGPGGPVGAATVTISDGTNTITTSSNSRGRVGHWSVSGLSTPGTYVVQAARPGLSSESRMVELAAGGTATADLRLRNGVASLIGKVRAVNQAGKLTGAGGVSVKVASEDGVVRSATTLTQGARAGRGSARASADFVGTYKLPGLTVPGSYVVTLSGPDLQTQTTKLTLRRGQSQATVDADLVAASGSVAGTITGLDTNGKGSGVVGSGLTLSNPDNTYKTMSTSDPAGSFLFNGVAPGTYALQTQFFGYVTDHVTITVRAGRITQVNRTINQIEGGVLAARSSVRGRAIDGSSGVPIECPTVDSECLTASVVEPGVDDDSDDDHTYRTTFLAADEFTLPDPQTDPEGGLLPGLHTVVVSAPHYSSAIAKVQVGDNQLVDLGTLELLPAPKIVGSITTVTDVPAANTCIWAVPPGGDEPPAGCTSAVTGGDDPVCTSGSATFDLGSTDAVCAYVPGTGGYSLEVPTDGTYTLYVQPQDPEYLAPAPTPVLLENGVTRNQSYILNRLGRLNITVRKAGALARLVPSDQTSVVVRSLPGLQTVNSATTDDDGVASFTRIAAQSYRVTATVPDPAPPGVPDDDAGLTASKDIPVGLNQVVAVRINLTRPIGAAVAKVAGSVNGQLKPVPNASVQVVGVTGYDDTDNPRQTPVGMVTETQGCFGILGAGQTIADLGTDCNPAWATTAPPSSAIGRVTYLSPVVSVKVIAPGYTDGTFNDVTLSTTDINDFPLSAKPVPLGTVVPEIDPPDPGFDWTQVSFTAIPEAGATPAITVRATGTGGTGQLTWQDTRVPGAPNQAIPGTYAISASLNGYIAGTATLECPVAVSSAVTCAWDGAPLKLQKLARLEVRPQSAGAAPVTGARYTLSRDGVAISTVTAGAGADSVAFTGLDPRDDDLYDVEVRAPGYAHGSTASSTSPLPLTCTPGGSSITLEPGGSTSCVASMTKLGTIQGTVIGSPAPPPSTGATSNVAGATVTVQRCTSVLPAAPATGTPYCAATGGPTFTGTTNAGGGFSITGTYDVDGLATDVAWLVTAEAPGYSPDEDRPADVPATALPGTLVRSFTDHVAEADVRLDLDPVDVSVAVLVGGVTASDATVTLKRLTSSGTEVVQEPTFDSATGRYPLVGIVPGSYILEVSGPGLVTNTWTQTISANNQVFTVSLDRAMNTIYGTILGSDASTGLKDADVWVCAASTCDEADKGPDNNRMSAKTAANGGFEIRNVPDGDFYVLVTKYGYRPYTSPAAIHVDHTLGAPPPVNQTLELVKRNVTITVQTPWTNNNLSAGTVALDEVGGSTSLSAVNLVATSTPGTFTASFNQVKWGCWTVTITPPVSGNHLGTPSALTGGPTDESITCTGDFALTVPSTYAASPVTATSTLDEGRLDVAVTATPFTDVPLGTSPPTKVVLTIKRGNTVVYTDDEFAVSSSPTTFWVPTGSAYTVSADLATPTPFWPEDSDSVTVPGSKPSSSAAAEADLDIDEQAATLDVTVTGGSGTDPQATLTLTGTSTVPPSYVAPLLTSGYKRTYYLPAGTWTVKADIGTRTKTEEIEITAPESTAPNGKYALTIVVPPPPSGGEEEEGGGSGGSGG